MCSKAASLIQVMKVDLDYAQIEGIEVEKMRSFETHVRDFTSDQNIVQKLSNLWKLQLIY